MRRRGAILPSFRIQDATTRLIERNIMNVFEGAIKLAVAEAQHTGLSLQVHDAILPGWFRKVIRYIRKAEEWVSSDEFRESLESQFASTEHDFFTQFMEDIPEKLTLTLQFALPTSEVFKRDRDIIREYYLDTSIERIMEGQSKLRQKFIRMLEQWIMGEKEAPGVEGIMESIKKESGAFSLYFARDQFARFNKSLTVASYQAAGVTKLQWWTVGDGRTRPSHRALHGKVFSVNDIPEEAHDYNCRCTFLAVLE